MLDAASPVHTSIALSSCEYGKVGRSAALVPPHGLSCFSDDGGVGVIVQIAAKGVPGARLVPLMD